jgi:hypothetical protein
MRPVSRRMVIAASCVVLGALLLALASSAGGATAKARYIAGDYHMHTYLTDGSYTQLQLAKKALSDFSLDWIANSEHSGTYAKDPFGNTIAPTWRWQSLAVYSWPIVRDLRPIYPTKGIIQGLEWAVPWHEEASVGFIGNEPTAVSAFEYRFAESDADTMSGAGQGIVKTFPRHMADTTAAVTWLEAGFKDTSYVIVNHPSRRGEWTASDLRSINDAAPDVCIGFEGIPGHQHQAERGAYQALKPTCYTWGGVDPFAAKVGGVWDSLLGEGRRFWMFGASDFHDLGADFWPGEYTRLYSWADDTTLPSILKSLRSGNSFVVQANLISDLEYTVSGHDASWVTRSGTMGDRVPLAKNSTARLRIRFYVPETDSAAGAPTVDHVDVIAGNWSDSRIPASSADYASDTNTSTKVIARVDRAKWTNPLIRTGWHTATVDVTGLKQNTYFRLRGTKVPVDTAPYSDAAGDPLRDDTAGPNNTAKAYANSWFYTNPIFVNVQ